MIGAYFGLMILVLGVLWVSKLPFVCAFFVWDFLLEECLTLVSQRDGVGVFDVTHRGEVYWQERAYLGLHCFFFSSWLMIFILVDTQQRQRYWLVWRDSCDEHTYRSLALLAKNPLH